MPKSATHADKEEMASEQGADNRTEPDVDTNSFIPKTVAEPVCSLCPRRPLCARSAPMECAGGRTEQV